MNVLSAPRHNGSVSRVALSYCAMKLLFVFMLVGSECVHGNDDLLRIDAIQPEQPCLAAGGMCTIAADCPDGHLSEQQGLCPKQKNQGIECCYGISTKETRCVKRGGVCMSVSQYCNERLISKEARDCPDDKRCCIMV